jgi:hypothetical protein
MINNLTHEGTVMTHEKTVLQQISDVAWLVHQGPAKLGILNKDVQEHYTYITGKELVKFNDQDAVVEHFGNMNLFNEIVNNSTKTSERIFIKGFEVDHDNPIIIDSTHPDYRDDLPVYAKIEGKGIYYAAGYYCINFEKGWKKSRGPKLATLDRYGYEGPFKTELEMRQRLKELNKRKRKNDGA